MDILVPPTELDRSFRGRFDWDSYERVEREFVARYLDATDSLLELGGCLGGVACVANERLADPSKHVVVEANPNLIPALTHNRDRNGCRFQIEHGMVSRLSDGTFFIYESILDCSGTARLDAGPPRAVLKVPVTTIREIEAKYHLNFNAVILDIEGGELPFLEENSEFLSGVDLLIVEFHRRVIGRGYARARNILIDLAFINIESSSDVEVWARQTRPGIPSTQSAGPLATLANLPPIETLSAGHEFAWDGVDGLYVRRPSDGDSADQDQGALELICGADDGRHRLGIRFRLPDRDGGYRVSAMLRSPNDVRMYLELRDGSGTNAGLALYDIRQAAVLLQDGAVREAGAAIADGGRFKVWAELDYAEQWGVLYIGFASSSGAISYQGDGRRSLQLCGLEIVSTAELAGPLMTVERLPPIDILNDDRLAWDGVDGLHVRRVIDPGALELICGADDGRHRLGIRFRLPAGEGIYRLSAVIRSTGDVRAYLELRDDSKTNHGLAIYQNEQASVWCREGSLRDAGVAVMKDGWIKVWAELGYADRLGVAYVGFGSPDGAVSYRAAASSSLQFLALEIDPIELHISSNLFPSKQDENGSENVIPNRYVELP